MKYAVDISLFLFLFMLASCSPNRFISLDSALASKKWAKVLDLSRDHLTEIPPGVFELYNLEELILFKNKIRVVPEEISQLTKLKRLVLSRNDLDSIAPGIGRLRNLEYLSLYLNELETLPEEIGNLEKLNEFNAEYNRLTELPSSIGNLKNLEFLYLGHNQLKTLPPEIGGCINLTTFHIGKNSMDYVPDELGDLLNLVELDVATAGPLLILPERLCNCLGLEYLYVDQNTVVPYCLQGYKNPRFNIIVK